MLIICPTCVSAYRVDGETSFPRPATARCAHCQRSFTVEAAAGEEDGSSRVVAPRPDDRTALLPSIASVSVQGFRPVRPLRAPAFAVEPRERSAARALAAAAVCLGVAMAGVAWHGTIGAAVPGLARWFGVAPDAGLTLQDVRTALAAEGDATVLTLQGRISNPQSSAAAVPNLRIVVRDGEAQSLYSWTTPSPRATLAAGETVAFRSRLVSPPAAGHDLVVSFAESTGEAQTVQVKGP